MNYYSKEALLSALKGSTNYVELNYKNGGVAVVSEYGGRLLGIFPKRESYSLLWINSKLKDTIESGQRAIGGDRYWISPEREYFYKNPETWTNWFCPPSLDPANYEILGFSKDSCTVSSSISIVNQASKDKFNGEITRQLSLIEEPISTGLQHYCGIEFIDDCVFFKPDLKINGWSLACIISGGIDNPGTVLIPTKSNPKPISYFRTIPEKRLRVGENYIAFKIDVDDVYKLAVRPDDIDFERFAKIGYILKIPESEEYGLLLKLSDDVPKSQDECFDISRDHPESEVGVIQSYNSESPEKPLLNFGEVELQLNLFKTIGNTSHGKAKHLLLGYIGSKEQIFEVIKKYLGITIFTMF